jgi:hypothetical protein
VEEPIALIRSLGQAASDDVWMGVDFIDRKHVERHAHYIVTWYHPVKTPNDPEPHWIETRHALELGEKLVSASGLEERAFLGLLQRWYRQDAEVQELTRHPPKREDFAKLTEQQQAKITGVRIMELLLERN